MELKNRPRNTLDGENGGAEANNANAKKKKATGRKKGLVTDTQFRLNLKEVAVDDGKLFENQTFCVMENEFRVMDASNSKVLQSFTRDQLMEEIRKQSGQVVANASFPNCKVIAGNKKTIQLKTVIDAGERDVIDFKYIIDCISSKTKIPLKGYYFLSMCAQTRLEMKGKYDVFGDSFTDEVSLKDLVSTFGNIEVVVGRFERKSTPKAYANKKRKLAMESQEIAPDEDELLALAEWESMKNLPWRKVVAEHFSFEEQEPIFHAANGFFQERVIVYLDMYRDLGSPTCDDLDRYRCCSLEEDKIDSVTFTPLQIAQFRVAFLQLMSRGALLTDHLHPAVTHVLMIPPQGNDQNQKEAHEDRCQRIQDRIRSLRLSDQHCFEKRLVNLRWLDDCLLQGSLVEPLPNHLIALP